MHFLHSLPSELLDQILSLHGMSFCALLLWLSGSPSLRHKMSTGLTRIKLRNRNEFALCRFPKFVCSLRSLRYLTINRASWTLLSPLDTRECLQQLSPTLTKLTLSINNGYNILSPPQATPDSASPSDASLQDAAVAYRPLCQRLPLLERLKLDERSIIPAKELDDLPPLLTSLSCAVPGEYVTRGDWMSLLPRRLSHFCSWSQLNDHFEKLPPSLTQLEGAIFLFGHPGADLVAISNLPRTLTRGRNVWTSDLFLKHLVSLPPSLTHLEVSMCERVTDSDFSMMSIFPQLRHLVDRNGYLTTPFILGTMPSTLVSLSSWMNINNMEPKNWPKSLTSLDVTTTQRLTPHSLEILPQSLKHLRLRPFYDGKDQPMNPTLLTFLPRSLTSLVIESHYEPPETPHSAISLPPNLKVLQWTLWRRWAIIVDSKGAAGDLIRSGLPTELISTQSLTRLNIACLFPASGLKHLPRRLKYLNILGLAHDQDFSIDNTLEKAAIREIWQVGRAEGMMEGLKFEEDFDVSGLLDLPNVPIFSIIIAMLPRTLKRLEIIFSPLLEADMTNSWFKFLPPRLHALRIEEPVHANFVFEAPLTCMRHLKVTLKSQTDEHILALPRRLSSKSAIQIEGMRNITRQTIVNWPPWVHVPGEAPLNALQWELQAQLREELSNEHDYSRLRKLSSTDDNPFINVATDKTV